MRVTEVALHPLVRDTEGAIVQLRREAVDAVARQQRLRQEVRAVRARGGEIEEEARRALVRGDDLLARQVLARGLCVLEARTHLESELDEARRHVAHLLSALVRAEDGAWGLRRSRAGGHPRLDPTTVGPRDAGHTPG
jgi:phage shock protein A